MNWLSSLLSWFEGESTTMAVAMLGGLIVALGLFIEKIAEFLDERFLGGYKAHKKMELAGWCILMFGIFIEVADAGWTAQQIRTAKDAERNEPISRMEATAYFVLMGTNFNELTNLPMGRKAQMTFLINEKLGTPLDPLVAGSENITGFIFHPAFGVIDRRTYRIQFHWLDFVTAYGFEYPAKTIDDVHIVHIDLNFLPHDSEIKWGRVILKINNFQKVFDVPEQNDTNSNLGTINDFSCWLVGTNGVKGSEKQWLYLRN